MTIDTARPTLRSAATHALLVLRDIQGDGIDVSDTIAALERALFGPPKIAPTERQPRNRWGFRFGQPLRVKSGRLEGEKVEYMRAASSRQVYVRYNGGRFTVYVENLEAA